MTQLACPVRNNAPLLPPGQRPSGPAAAAGLDFRIIPAGFNAPLGFESQRLEFLTGFTSGKEALEDLPHMILGWLTPA